MKFETIKAEHFVEQYMDYPVYDNIRKIASVVDGLKNSSRKVIYYCIKHQINNPVKTSQFRSKVEEETEYLHGDISSVVETLAKDYTGTNNLPLLRGHGNFGTRLIKDASAPRYTYITNHKNLSNMFDKNDFDILKKQYFEGNEIEPTYLMPIVPLILVNGSEGISSGFSQKILNRDVKQIVKAIKLKLKKGLDNHIYDEYPYYEGYIGTIERESTNKWIVHGSIDVCNSTTVRITEVPFTYDISSYKKVLNHLEEKGVIKSYKDYSQGNYDIEVKFERKTLANYKTDKDILKALKLIKPITENYTLLDKDNKIIIFDNVNDLLNYWINVRLEFSNKKIEHLISKLKRKDDILKSKKHFIEQVINNKIDVKNKRKKEIEENLEFFDLIKVDDSYDYLLNMSIYSLTKERIDKLQKEIDELIEEIEYYKNITSNDFYLDELKNL